MKFTTFPENVNPFIKKGVVKLGIDPTGPDLHLGHLLPIKLFKKFKNEGFDPHIILGTFTAQIGDASGRDTTRPILTPEQTKNNADKILSQIKRILGDDINVHFNTEWFDKMSLIDIMDIMSKFSVQKLLSRDSFSKRIDSNTPIAMHELMGPVLQGIDSFKLKTVVEIGGTDQLFNFSISRDIQEIMGQLPQVSVFTPVINGTDGRKMSKSFGNCIFLNDSPDDVFGKVMSISDSLMREWQPIFFDSIDVNSHPMKQKKELAKQVTMEIWGEKLAELALNNFESIVQNKEIPDDIFEVPLSNLVEIVKNVLKSSKSKAKQLISESAVKVNGIKVDEKVELKSGDIVKIGKRNFVKIT